MTCKQMGGWCFAFAVTGLVAAFCLGVAAFGPAGQAFAHDEPDFLVLNPHGE